MRAARTAHRPGTTGADRPGVGVDSPSWLWVTSWVWVTPKRRSGPRIDTHGQDVTQAHEANPAHEADRAFEAGIVSVRTTPARHPDLAAHEARDRVRE